MDEHLVLTEMVEERAEAGRRALGACFQRCQAEIGNVGLSTLTGSSQVGKNNSSHTLWIACESTSLATRVHSHM